MVRWLLSVSMRAAKRLAWKMLRGFRSRLTVHHSGIRFTCCNSVRDFLFHMIMYILDAAPPSWFVKLLFQANVAPGSLCFYFHRPPSMIFCNCTA